MTTPKSPGRLVFFGNERLVSGLRHTEALLLTGLIQRGYEIVAIVVNQADTKSRNARELEVATLAREHSIPLLSPDKPADIIEDLVAFSADAAILSAYGRILSGRIINVFNPIGIINIHPSLLPRHRGPTPIESTILDGDKVAGVSIMQLTPGMDEGPIYAQTSFATTGHEEKFELYEKLSKAGADLLFDVLPSILNNKLEPKPQSNIDVSVTSLISKDDSKLDPYTDDASVLDRKIRAYQGYPKPRLSLFDNEVIITSATVVDAVDPNALLIPCHGDTWLRIDSLIAPSGRSMDGASYMRGYKK
jgi:methionyl-tRNA formyltransferase